MLGQREVSFPLLHTVICLNPSPLRPLPLSSATMRDYVPRPLSLYDPPTRHRHPMCLLSPFMSRVETHYPPHHLYFIRSRSPTPTPLSSLTPLCHVRPCDLRDQRTCAVTSSGNSRRTSGSYRYVQKVTHSPSQSRAEEGQLSIP